MLPFKYIYIIFTHILIQSTSTRSRWFLVSGQLLNWTDFQIRILRAESNLNESIVYVNWREGRVNKLSCSTAVIHIWFYKSDGQPVQSAGIVLTILKMIW